MKENQYKKLIAPGDSKDTDFVDRSTERSVPAKASEQTAALLPKAFPVVGIGASAGGLEAFTQLLKHLPVDTGMGFVLVQHL
ncbi:MAG: chemotaxis protein CheB, partial [Opitutus sp.]